MYPAVENYETPIEKASPERKPQPNIKEWLLAEEPRFDDIVPERGGWKSRPAIDFSGPEFRASESTIPTRTAKRRG